MYMLDLTSTCGGIKTTYEMQWSKSIKQNQIKLLE